MYYARQYTVDCSLSRNTCKRNLKTSFCHAVFVIKKQHPELLLRFWFGDAVSVCKYFDSLTKLLTTALSWTPSSLSDSPSILWLQLLLGARSRYSWSGGAEASITYSLLWRLSSGWSTLAISLQCGLHSCCCCVLDVVDVVIGIDATAAVTHHTLQLRYIHLFSKLYDNTLIWQNIHTEQTEFDERMSASEVHWALLGRDTIEGTRSQKCLKRLKCIWAPNLITYVWYIAFVAGTLFCLGYCYYHHNHHHREVLTDRCAPPWPLATSDLHIVDNGLASASWIIGCGWATCGVGDQRASIVQVVDGFLPSWLSTISWRAAFTGTHESRRAMWPKRDRRRLSNASV